MKTKEDIIKKDDLISRINWDTILSEKEILNIINDTNNNDSLRIGFYIKSLETYNDIYNCLIQPKITKNRTNPEWFPVITLNDRNYLSSGRLSMIKKENRYNPQIKN